MLINYLKTMSSNLTLTIIWSLASISFFIFLRYFLFPFLYRKYIFYKFSKKFLKMSKKYDGELKEKLADLSDSFKDLNRNEKI